MKKLFSATAALALFALTAPANAADLPVKAPPMVMPALYNWTGLYVGIEGGGIAGQNTELIDLYPHFFNAANPNFNIGVPLHGGFAGGEAGFNWQPAGSRWVLGIEGDGNWARIEGSIGPHGSVLPGFVCGLGSPNDMACGAKVRDFETARIRIGYAFGPRGDFLAFVTGGWAGASMSSSAAIMGCSGGPGNSFGGGCVVGVSGGVVNFSNFDEWKRHNGFTVGMGAEYGITPYLSLKGEVLYVWLDRQTYCGNSPTPPCSTFSTFPGPGGTLVFKDDTTLKADFIAARMALNWRFWWGKAPVAVVARY